MTLHDKLSQDFLHDLSRHPSEPGVQTLELHGQAKMINPEQMQECGMKVMNAHRILNRSIAQFIRSSVGQTALNTATGQHE